VERSRPSLLSLRFVDSKHLIGFYVSEHLTRAARPDDADVLNLVRFSQTEVDSLMARRSVTDAGRHVAVLVSYLDAGANGVAVALRSF
jgi:hypothetical protein